MQNKGLPAKLHSIRERLRNWVLIFVAYVCSDSNSHVGKVLMLCYTSLNFSKGSYTFKGSCGTEFFISVSIVQVQLMENWDICWRLLKGAAGYKIMYIQRKTICDYYSQFHTCDLKYTSHPNHCCSIILLTFTLPL